MYGQLRKPEKLFRIGQWAVALLFAFFLTMVGSSIIGDLPSLSSYPEESQFVDEAAIRQIELKAQPYRDAQTKLSQERERNEHALEEARNRYDSAKESFNNWLAARSTTEQSEQNPAVIAKTRELDQLNDKVLELENKSAALLVQIEEQRKLQEPVNREVEAVRDAGNERYRAAVRSADLKAFGIRLAFVLPILLIAIWLFRRHRKAKNWPFAWGFILFALFAFFFELVPYLPSFGGYIRYGVGAVLTFFGGRILIQALQRYVEQKKLEQQIPQEERKQDIRYEKALESMARGVCPSCERSVPNVEGSTNNFCMHCSLMLFNHCSSCKLRKNAFFQYCPTCGTASQGPGRIDVAATGQAVQT